MNYGDYTALFTDARGELCYMADIDTHDMLFMSRSAMQLTGVKDAGEYTGKKCYQIMQGLDAPCAFCQSEKLLAGEGPCVWEHFNPVAQKWLRLESRLFELDGRRCRGEWALDISDAHQRISSLETQLEREQVLARSVRTLATAPDTRTAVNQFLCYIGQYYQADRACIFEIDSDGAGLSNTFEWCADGISSQMSSFQAAPMQPVQHWMNSFSGEEPRHFSFESQRNTGMEAVLSARNVQGVLVVPLMRQGIRVGFLGVDNVRMHGDDPALLGLAAALVTEEFQKRQLIQDLDSRRYTDRLTGLQNRRKYTQVLKEYRLHAPASLAVFYLDLDGMHDLNEQLGHEAGDLFICQCAEILRQMQLNAFRVDGDEFIVLQENIGQAEAQALEEELRSHIARLQPNSISIGSAWRDGDADALSLVSIAAERMYAQKQAYYRSVMDQPRPHRTGMAAEVLKEILSKHFVPYYQPQVNLHTGEITGAEALLRKLDSDGNFIPPDHFIPIYESAEVISHVDFHVLDMVCQQIRSWQAMGLRPRISVNFSRKSLMEPDAAGHMHSICQRYGVDPGQLNIEVTENAAKLSRVQLQKLAAELQAQGFSVSLDDFGVRDSNLSTLAGVDFQLIKLDKSLVELLTGSERTQRIVSHLLEMCKNTLGTPVLAEGVETPEQAGLLMQLQCDYAQGYYFSRPLPSDDFTALLQSGKRYDIPASLPCSLSARESRIREALRIQSEENARLRASTQALEQIAQHSDRKILYYDSAAGRLYSGNTGGERGDLQEYCIDEMMASGRIPPESHAAIRRMQRDIQDGIPSGHDKIMFISRQGRRIWLDVKYSSLFQEGSGAANTLVSIQDITRQHDHEIAYLRTVGALENSMDSQLMFLECDLTANLIEKIGGSMLPGDSAKMPLVPAEYVNIWVSYAFSEGERPEVIRYFSIENLIQMYAQGKLNLSSQWKVRFQDGTPHWVQSDITLIEDPYNRHVKAFILVRDITDEKQEQLEIQRRAERDSMTGLLNRGTAEAMIHRKMAEENSSGILIVLDLDDLKGINDVFGHKEGDRAIMAIADTLKGHFRETDVVVRFGGDEFVIYLPGAASSSDAIAVSITGLLRKLAGISIGENGQRRIHCSVGCAVQRHSGVSFDALYRQADTALYHVKRNGKSNFAFYSPEMEQANFQFQARHLFSRKLARKYEAAELHQLLQAIAGIYQLVMSVNLSANDYYLMEEVENGIFADIPTFGVLDDFMDGLQAGLHPDDAELFINTLGRKALMQAYADGKRQMHLCFRFMDGEIYRPVEATVAMYENEVGNICEFSLIRWAD